MNKGTVAGGERLQIGWIALVTGNKPNQDYQPTASHDTDPDVVSEVTRICVALHPESELRQFPRERDVLLFWRTRRSQEYVVTRVCVSPNPEGVRTALEYHSLLLPPTIYEKLGSPFQVRDYGLFDLVREQVQAQGHTPIDFQLPDNDARAILPLSIPPGFERGGRALEEAKFAPGKEPPANDENVRELEEYCGVQISKGCMPPTFASWWPNSAPIPPDYFDVVLRAKPPQVMTLKEATSIAASLAESVKSSLPNATAGDTIAATLSQTIVANVDAVFRGVNDAVERVNGETADQFHERMVDISGKAARVSNDLTSFQKRLAVDRGNEDFGHLASFAKQYENLAADVAKLRHPNPFGFINPSPSSTRSLSGLLSERDLEQLLQNATPEAATPQRPARAFNPLLIVGPLLLLGVGGIWMFMPHSSGAPTAPVSGITTPVNITHPNTNVANNSRGPLKPVEPSQPSISSLLLSKAGSVKNTATESAYSKAFKRAKDTGELKDNELHALVVQEIKTAYQTSLTPEQYDQVFGNTTNWKYDQYKKLLGKTDLLAAVSEQARLGSEKGVANRPPAVPHPVPGNQNVNRIHVHPKPPRPIHVNADSRPNHPNSGNKTHIAPHHTDNSGSASGTGL